MYLRIITGRAQTGQSEELARQWQAFFETRLRAMPGFRQGHFAGDRATDVVVSVTLWDAEPDAVQIQRNLEEFLAVAGHLVASPPQAAGYEVLAAV